MRAAPRVYESRVDDREAVETVSERHYALWRENPLAHPYTFSLNRFNSSIFSNTVPMSADMAIAQ